MTATEKAPPEPMGRRERKKAATRAAIARAALDLFLERGFDEVSVRDVAERADVAVATIFAHFSGKEALVFDEQAEVSRSLIAAVTEGGTHADALAVLQDWFLATRTADHARSTDPSFAAFRRLMRETPALHAYWQRTWRRDVPALAAALQEAAGLDARLARLTATLVIEGYLLAAEDDQPDRALELLFEVLRAGIPGADSAGVAAGAR